MTILKLVSHGGPSLDIATQHGWLPAARYTDLRKVRSFKKLGMLDINWKRYCHQRHLSAAQQTRPFITVARDIETIDQIDVALREAASLSRFSEFVVVVPKVASLPTVLDRTQLPDYCILGYSVPTRYGKTELDPSVFSGPVHLLGGRPDVQRRLADRMSVVSMDCNRFTLDAQFGDYFDGETFRPHPKGGYEACLSDSVREIGRLWSDYKTDRRMRFWKRYERWRSQ